jgi:Uma2 family endonuclease
MAKGRKNSLEYENLAELVKHLGGVPLKRILMKPLPGTATEKDVIAAARGPLRRLCELVDGILVEKAIGMQESQLAATIIYLLLSFLEEDDRGTVFGADNMLRLLPGLVRIPDVSYIPWEHLPGEKVTGEKAISPYVATLVVEVLSKSNTKKEIALKVREYFLAGTRLVWVIHPRTETAEVYTSPEDVRKVPADGVLDGGEVLPGFRLSLADLFRRTGQRRKRA